MYQASLSFASMQRPFCTMDSDRFLFLLSQVVGQLQQDNSLLQRRSDAAAESQGKAERRQREAEDAAAKADAERARLQRARDEAASALRVRGAAAQGLLCRIGCKCKLVLWQLTTALQVRTKLIGSPTAAHPGAAHLSCAGLCAVPT